MAPHKNHQPSMENHREKSSSAEKFSFPSTPVDSEDFEFGCFTPDSASSDPCKDSPADHLFSNGKLLPHSFPFQPNTDGMLLVVDHSRRTSRTSSISSRDSLSLMSSRSNSTNSRSSCSSSARTSSSDSSERKLLNHYNHSRTTTAYRSSDRYRSGSGSGQVFGSSQRWQFITPVPSSLSRETSVKKRVEVNIGAAGKGKQRKAKKGGKAKKTAVVRRRRLCRRFFRWLVSSCIKCHAMEPSKKSDVNC